MNISIRKFLLINLLLAITITTTLTAIGNYYLNKKEIKHHLDSWLLQSALSLQAVVGTDFSPGTLHEIQAKLDKIPKQINIFHHHKLKTFTPYASAGKFQFQVWSKDGKLLLRSANSPEQPLAKGGVGFSDRVINDAYWRIFSTDNKKLGITFVIAERYDIRNQLANRIAKDDVYIMFLTYPLSGLLIWIIIGRGLGSLKRVSSEISHRAPNYLEPVNIKAVPLEIKPLIDELNKLLLRLHNAFEREKRFSADAAHELRTPLAALKTQAQVALNTSENAQTAATLKNVLTGVDRCAHVVQQLLTLSRLVPEASGIYDTSDVNLPKLCAEIIAQQVPTAIDKKTEIELDSQSNDITVKGNVTALSILIRNLVDNAIRYTPEGGNITVTIVKGKNHILLKVTDNGPGIPPELRSRVFERFYRVLGNKSPGSGLGLAIVQQIAKLHHADVRLGAPKSGEGLEIEIAFPA